MRLLVDMHLSPRWTDVLRKAGCDSIHRSQVGKFDAPDSEIMAYAASNRHVVLTHDLDFSAILAASRGGNPSAVQIRSGDVAPEAIGNLVIAALRNSEVELTTGAIVTIEPDRTRFRLLPLK